MYYLVIEQFTDGDYKVRKMSKEDIMKIPYKDELIIIEGELIKGPDSKFDSGRLKGI